MIAPEVLNALLQAGATAEMIVAAVNADNEQAAARLAEKRQKDRERQRRHRLSRDVTVTNGDSADNLDKEKGPTPQKEINPPSGDKSPSGKTRAREGFTLPAHIPAEPWQNFVAMRQRIRKPMTDYAKTLAVAELDKLAEDGWPPGDVLNNSTMNSYQGLVPPKVRKNDRSHQDRPEEPRDPMVRAVLASQAERAGLQ